MGRTAGSHGHFKHGPCQPGGNYNGFTVVVLLCVIMCHSVLLFFVYHPTKDDPIPTLLLICGGFHTWDIPKMVGLYWKLLLK